MAKKIYENQAAKNVASFTEPSKEHDESVKSAPQIEKMAHRGPGRPSKGKTFTISLKLPIGLKNGIEKASLVYGGNKTKYLQELIEKDLQENKDRYEELGKLLNGKN